MRNPFRRWTHRLTPTELREYRHTTSDERYAADAMPADWPAFTADLFAWPDRPAVDGPVMWDANTGTVTPIPDRIEAWEHVDAVLGEHPAVADLRAAVDMARAHDTRDPLEAHTALMLQRHEEDQAYAAGRRMYYWGENCEAQSAVDCARLYLRDDPEHGARLAALVLAGYTGTPRELVR